MNGALKQKVVAGGPTVGSWLSLGSLPVAEIMADAGFEWLVIDMEHSATTMREAESIIRYLDARGCSPLVRVSENSRIEIRRMMDAGAHGVVVPMVNSASDAAGAVASVRYPPSGARGVSLCRANRYGLDFEAYVEALPRDAIVVAQIEHHRGVEALEDIVGVEGVDATIVGPYDLSASVGKPGRYGEPDVAALLDRYRRVSRARGKTSGFHVVDPDPEQLLRRVEEGYGFLSFSTDFLFLGRSACAGMKRVHDALRG